MLRRVDPSYHGEPEVNWKRVLIEVAGSRRYHVSVSQRLIAGHTYGVVFAQSLHEI